MHQVAGVYVCSHKLIWNNLYWWMPGATVSVVRAHSDASDVTFILHKSRPRRCGLASVIFRLTFIIRLNTTVPLTFDVRWSHDCHLSVPNVIVVETVWASVLYTLYVVAQVSKRWRQMLKQCALSASDSWVEEKVEKGFWNPSCIKPTQNAFVNSCSVTLLYVHQPNCTLELCFFSFHTLQHGI